MRYFMDSIARGLKSIFCRKEKKQIASLSELVADQKVLLFKLKQDIKDCEGDKGKIRRQLEVYESMINQNAVRPPGWLKVDGNHYVPKAVTENDVVRIVDVREFYYGGPQINKLIDDLGIRDADHDEKLDKIWKYVVERITYKYDRAENWQHPHITNDLKYGDCEDGTILFVAMCHAASIPADSVFNACGWYLSNGEKIGHSYPVAKKSDGKWYVYESTLNTKPAQPKLFAGSNYDASWGVSNWLYKGSVIQNGERKYQF